MRDTGFKPLYSRFLAASADVLHFAAHSHHFWPDVSREAQLAAWDDACRLNDRKWEHVFGTVVPQVRQRIAGILGFKHPEQIALAPNTHELLVRVFSALPTGQGLRVLSSDGEFHSFARQLKRWEEDGAVTVERLAADQLLTDREAWLAHAAERVSRGGFDVVFLSQVFFNSGLALSAADFQRLFAGAPSSTVLVVDGYHGFAALPEDWGPLEGRIFYLAGGYKYAQAGEGVCFLAVPAGQEWRPRNTGWFAELGELAIGQSGKVGYPQDGMAFWGSTQDPTGWYRFLAVWNQWQRLGVGVAELHRHARDLQKTLLDGLKTPGHRLQGLRPLHDPTLTRQGHFLTWEAPSEAQGSAFREALLRDGVYIDQRGPRLRFGFGAYQDRRDVECLLEKLRTS